MVLEFNKDPHIVTISMPKYAKKVLDEYPLENYKAVTTLYDKDLFKIQDSQRLTQAAQKIFHSTVMRILFYVSIVRPDVLVTVNLLTTRTRLGTATKEDRRKLIRLLDFIYTTQQNGIILGGDSDGVLRLRAYADASYGVHIDGKSHMGNVIILGRGPIFSKSSKQRSIYELLELELYYLSDTIDDNNR